MTIRELVISLGYEIDKGAEKKVNDSIDGLKSAASEALAANPVGYEVDKASEKQVKESIEGLEDAAAPLADSRVGFEVDRSSARAAKSRISGLRSFALKMLGALGIGFSLAALRRLSEEFNDINDQIRDATRGMGSQHEIQQRILRAANDTRQDYAVMANTINRLAQTNAFPGIDEAANFATLIARDFTAAGKSQEKAAYLTRYITMDLQKGSVSSRTITTMFRDAPHMVNRLAESLGVTTYRLQDMASAGELSADVLKRVFIDSADDINARFHQTDMNISDALRNIRNGWGLFVDEMNDTLGVSRAVARGIVTGFNHVLFMLRRGQNALMRLADRMGGLRNLIRLLTIVAGAFMIAIASPKIMEVVKAMIAINRALLKTKAKMLAVVAVIVLLALLIEDFFAFMRGDDSLIGEALERLGIDADAARERIHELWERFKAFLPTLARWGAMALATIAALKILIGLFKALTAVTKIYTAAMKILNLVKKANPIGLLIMLIAGLIAVFVALWRNNEGFRNFFINMWEGIKSFFAGVVGFIGRILGGLRDKFSFVIDSIRDSIAAFMQIIRGIIDFIAGVFTGDWERAWNGVRNIFEGIISGLAAMFKIPINGIISMLNVFIRGLNRLKIPDWVPGVGGKGINIPEIPKLAKGSDFSPDTFIAGEEGPELVTNAKGSKVFTAAETAGTLRKLNALADWEVPDFVKESSKHGKGMPTALKDFTRAMLTPADEPARVYRSHVENKHITQYNEFYSEFHGDRAGQERSAEAMERASDDATDELARAIVYVT